jgi:hypothetical protein
MTDLAGRLNRDPLTPNILNMQWESVLFKKKKNKAQVTMLPKSTSGGKKS